MTKNTKEQNRKYAAERRQRLANAGLCLMCGKISSLDGKTRCGPCFEKHNLFLRKSYERRKKKSIEENLCSNCLKNEPINGSQMCEVCALYARDRYYKRKERGICAYCTQPALDGLTRCLECSEKHKLDRKLLRKEIFEAYGGAICNCCGETMEKFLTIDHVNNDGSNHRKKLHQSMLYKWLKQKNFPIGFQVLCWNCNIGKSKNGGVCPHKENA